MATHTKLKRSLRSTTRPSSTRLSSKRPSSRPPRPFEPIPTFDGEAALPDDPTIRIFYHQAHRSDGGVAFVPDPEDGTPIVADDAESFAEEFIATVTAGEGVEMDAIDEVVDEEDGGPFLEIESEADIKEALGLSLDDLEPSARTKRSSRRDRV